MRTVILGDFISDVYINVDNIKQNQEIINSKSLKGYYKDINVFAGGTGFFIDCLIKQFIDNKLDIYDDIIYLLPSYKANSISCSNLATYIHLDVLYDKSIKYLYEKYNEDKLSIIKMEPIDYIYDIIKPTVKMRFISKEKKKVYFRFDYDNDINLKTINFNNVFDVKNDNTLIVIDYDKGYFNKSSIDYMTKYIIDNDVNISDVFINTKPNNIKLYENLFYYLKTEKNVHTVIQLNNDEFKPVKEYLLNNALFNSIIVTRGTKDIYLYTNDFKVGGQYTKKVIDTSETIIKNIHTTSGCGDLFFANVIFNYLYNYCNIEYAIVTTLQKIKKQVRWLNRRIFK